MNQRQTTAPTPGDLNTAGTERTPPAPETQQEEPSRDQLLLLAQTLRAQADESRNQALLARADMENLRRRTEREIEGAHKYALEKFVRELLPVKDSLELGLNSATGEHPGVEKLREGMELTLKLLGGALEKSGVREINPVGEKFNPEQHQAMATQPAAGVENNTVLQVYQKGYLLNDRLVRPALVVVSSAVSQGF